MNHEPLIPTHRPTGEEIAKGLEYAFVISDDLDFGGTIWRYSDIICWDYEAKPKESPYLSKNVKQELVFRNYRGQEVLQIQRSRELCNTHYLYRDDEIVGVIKSVTTCRNRYTIQLDGSPLWTFHLPLFETTYWATSTDEQRIWARVWKRKQHLRLLVPPELAAAPHANGDLQNSALLPALAFIHREWWCWVS